MRLLVRHADAGVRRQRPGPDEWRGLTAAGHAQAQELVARLGGLPLLRVLTSPSLRCRQTVTPLARDAWLEVEPCRLLAIDADPTQLLRLLQHEETENAVLCTHRETLLGLFSHLALSGSRLIEGIARMNLAAAWALYGGPDVPTRLRYLPALWEPTEPLLIPRRTVIRPGLDGPAQRDGAMADPV